MDPASPRPDHVPAIRPAPAHRDPRGGPDGPGADRRAPFPTSLPTGTHTPPRRPRPPPTLRRGVRRPCPRAPALPGRPHPARAPCRGRRPSPGTVPLAVVSADDGRIVHAGLAATGLDGLFRTVIAREHVTRLKPAPEAYRLAARRLGPDPGRCLAFEDTDDGIAADRTAGMPVDVRHPVWYPRRP
ncbi:HAD family hydrolase [Streptomyces sp. NPDC059533]|uniref:HAD family hydrolase n=1 Tax=Streptomyces sp. NPDC059533 TaxID=3346858 RepID=UPI0036B0F79D